MDVSNGNIVERIARVLAGQRLSANAKGDSESAGAAVDAAWRDHRDDAIAVLKTMREPDRTMAQVGELGIWDRMIQAAIDEATSGAR
jgi:hypothetical protein